MQEQLDIFDEMFDLHTARQTDHSRAKREIHRSVAEPGFTGRGVGESNHKAEAVPIYYSGIFS